MIPRYAVLDPKLTYSLPNHLTATTGMDALTHAVEAYIGKSTTRRTRKLSSEAVRLIFENILFSLLGLQKTGVNYIINGSIYYKKGVDSVWRIILFLLDYFLRHRLSIWVTTYMLKRSTHKDSLFVLCCA